jgi:hypothetical protein
MNPNKPSLRVILFQFAALVLLLSGFSPGVFANPNEGRSLVAPYVYVPASIPGIAGPYSTEYWVAATTGSATMVNIKCYNEFATRIGAAGGVSVNLTDGSTNFDTDMYTPVTLGLTTDPGFTPRGWCWFQYVSGDDFAVSVAMGFGNGQGAIFTNNNSRLVSMDTALGSVSGDDSAVPFWVRTGGGESTGGGWETYLLALNPTTTSLTLTVNVYGTAGTLVGSDPLDGVSFNPLGARDIDIYLLGTAGTGTTTRGNADLTSGFSSTRGYAAWILGINYVSLESFMYAVPMDEDDDLRIASLGVAP